MYTSNSMILAPVTILAVCGYFLILIFTQKRLSTLPRYLYISWFVFIALAFSVECLSQPFSVSLSFPPPVSPPLLLMLLYLAAPVSAVARRTSSCSMWALSCGTWGLVTNQGSNRSLLHWSCGVLAHVGVLFLYYPLRQSPVHPLYWVRLLYIPQAPFRPRLRFILFCFHLLGYCLNCTPYGRFLVCNYYFVLISLPHITVKHNLWTISTFFGNNATDPP